MDMDSILDDIFNTMLDRFKSEDAKDSFTFELGIDLSGQGRTISIHNNTCTIIDSIKENCAAVVHTGKEEWIGITTNTMDPIAVFLAKKLTVDGDIDGALSVMNLFEYYTSEKVAVKEPSWVIETLGDNFTVDESGLFMIEELDCEYLANQFGTPLFVTSEAQIRHNIRKLTKAFRNSYPENDVNVMWAIKSNTTLAFRKIMNQEGAGGDCFSPGEVYATFLTGADPDKFLLNGSDRSEETFRMAIELGMRITLDHMDDLEIVERLGEECGKKIQTLIRVKSDMFSLQDLKSTFYPGVTVPLEVLNYKFGVTYSEAVEIANASQKLPHIEIEGIHSHIGRDLHLPEHWRLYAYDMIRLCKNFMNDTGIEPKILDLGGGFAEIRDPSSHNLNNLAASAEDYADNVCQGIRKGCNEFNFPFPKLWVEPGRHLIGSTTVLISRVGNVKRTPGVCTWVHTDASTNFLSGAIRHNGMSYHMLAGTRARDKAVETVDIVGPNCAGDLIQPRRKMPKLERGDLLIFLDVGAYNTVYANQFNCIPRPASVLVSGKHTDIVCERETLQDVFAHQQVPARLLGA
jgi:diaminopimelate decarboxylase